MVNVLKRLVPLLAAALMCFGCSQVPSLSSNPWQVVDLPTETTPLDLFLSETDDHGWLVGKSGTLLETRDGGTTWVDRSLDFGDLKYNLTSVSFAGSEGWIVGKPSLLLHTDDDGQSWAQIPLSSKLPGDPNSILALGPNSAEMTTDLGAIYQTEDGGRHWKALVQEAVGVLRNVSRSPDGSYIAVSARGNYFSTWEPGESAWVPHNRTSSRRLQNMGFTPDHRLWAIARGGQIQFGEFNDNPPAAVLAADDDGLDLEDVPDNIDWKDIQNPELEASWGFLDLAYRTQDEIWIAGGSGNLLSSFDGGETWVKDREVESIPSNLYKIRFFGPDHGFILGQNGVLLRYDAALAPQPQAASDAA